ncbi:MAG: hypothetical protein PUF72_07065 [Clostridiales bacterium]|nr:hypothetical protein [Clostridiales bacterium]
MKHFYIKALFIILLSAIALVICASAVFTEKPALGSDSAYAAASWLSKHGVNIRKELIDTSIHDVYEAELVSIGADKDEAAKLLVGADMKKGAADTYTGERGTLVFSGTSFELVTSQDCGNIDRYNAAKTAEKFIKETGMEVSGSMISAVAVEEGYNASFIKTINSLPVFNDVMTVHMTGDKIVKVSGVWYFGKEEQGKKRTAKSAVDALAQYLRLVQNEKKDIAAMELGYVLENTDKQTARIKPVWRITDSNGVVSLIDA